jgi:tyrosine-protein phosphatase SIW14
MLRTAALCISAAICWTCASAASVAAEDPRVLPNFQIVNANVLRGGQPTDEGISRLAQRGVKTIIDLRLASEHSIPHEKQLVESNGMHFVSVPIRGMAAPTDEQLYGVLRILNDSKQWPVFVHCRRGADRTGTILACYRISHDSWNNQKALEEAKTYGISIFERAMRNFIEHFKPSFTLSGTPEP